MAVRSRWHNGGIQDSDIPSSYWQAQRMLKAKPQTSKFLGGGENTLTYLEWRATNENWPSDDYAIRLVNTDVVTFHQNGEITLNSGGWRTKTTAQRINEALPGKWRLGSRRVTRNGFRGSYWWLHYAGQPIMEFEDGMRFDPDNQEIRGGLI